MLTSHAAAWAWLWMVTLSAVSAGGGHQDLSDTFKWLLLAAEAAGIASYWLQGGAVTRGRRSLTSARCCSQAKCLPTRMSSGSVAMALGSILT